MSQGDDAGRTPSNADGGHEGRSNGPEDPETAQAQVETQSR